MRYLLFLVLSILSSTLVFAAEETSVLIEEDTATNQEATESISKLLLNQLKENELDAQNRKQNFYEELRRKYPDVVPPQQVQRQTSGLSNLVYDSGFANTIFFSPGSSFLTNIQKEKLDSIAQTMLDEPTFNLVIVGHSSFNTQIEDPEQRFYYNSWISGRRSVQVWNYFVQKGIDENRLIAFAKDSQEPLNGEDTIAETNMNRRVELRLTNQPVPIGSGSRVAQSPSGQQPANNSVQQ